MISFEILERDTQKSLQSAQAYPDRLEGKLLTPTLEGAALLGPLYDKINGRRVQVSTGRPVDLATKFQVVSDNRTPSGGLITVVRADAEGSSSRQVRASLFYEPK